MIGKEGYVMKEIYIMRHSEPLNCDYIKNSDSMQLQNEKQVLSIHGEEIAKNKSMKKELQDFDYVVSSNYIRAISTAKYFTNTIVHINEDFGERKFGINSWDELPLDFGQRQVSDFNYKMPNGESLFEVQDRMYNGLLNILNNPDLKNKKILILSHGTAMFSLLTKWCDMRFEKESYFREKPIFSGKFDFCETFKLYFDEENELIDIENVID
jgi:2,3-bisphosphoglycerate-dependent phosphoglycerate mutase